MMTPRDERQRRQVDELVDQSALEEFLSFHGHVEFAPVVVVIAAYHERDNIGAVVESIPKTLCGLDVSVLVVVDGEDDGASAIVRKLGAFALICPVNRGQGAALRIGYRTALSGGAQYIVTADADGQSDPDDLAHVLQPVVDGEADFVSGSRTLGATESTDTVRNVGIRFFSVVISRLTGTAVSDTANPIRAMRADLPARLTLDEPQYQSSELLIGALFRGARYTERPVTMRARASGHSKKGHNLVYGYRFSRVVFRTWWRERRLRRSPRAT
ncbi:MAG TPA: glycosyltransferase family 2 protein [Acidimicrobiales bacterium]|nr:glycosyltransferase family 2 protein [Acidimicrobiales bacterium]